MQKVVGSSPIIRFPEKPRSRGVFCWGVRAAAAQAVAQ
jgi:hypothetical protein